MDKTTISIEIKYSDGSSSFAKGADAEQIMKWWNSCEQMNWIHGASYKGPVLTHIGNKEYTGG